MLVVYNDKMLKQQTSSGLSRLKQNNRIAGFTLVELMMVLVVSAVLLGIAVPSYKSFIHNQRIKNASFELFASLIVARSEAIKSNGDVTITPTSGSWQAGWKITNAGGTIIKNHAALSGVVVTGAPSTLVYKRTGRLSNASAPSFQMDVSPTDASYKRCISVDLSGAPRTSKGPCT